MAIRRILFFSKGRDVKYAIPILIFVGLLALPLVMLGQTPPTPDKIQALQTAITQLQADDATYQTQATTVQTDANAVAAANQTLATDTTTANATAATVNTDVTAVIAAAQALATASKTTGPYGPHGGPGPQPFHGGGDFHGGYGGWHGDYAPGPHYQPNPWNFVVPVITNFATAPRYVTNPATGQAELRPPGQWVQPAPGQWAWQALPMWPLLGKTAPRVLTTPIPAIPRLPHPVIRCIKRRLHRLIDAI